MNWTIFSSFTAQIDGPMQAAVAGVVASLFPSLLQAFQAGLAIWLAMLGYRLVWGRGTFPMQDMVVGVIYAAAVASAMTATVYNQYVTSLFLNLPGQIAAGIAGGNFNVSSFDTLWGKAYVAGLKTWQAAGFGFALIPIAIIIGLYWFISIISIGFGYIIWLASHVILYLAIAIGPIFFVMFLFPPLRGYFERWVGVLIGATVVQIMIAALLSVILTAETTLMGTITVTGDPFASMQMLLVAAVLFVFSALLLKEVPGIGTALAGGVHFQAARFTQSMVNAGGRMLGAVGTAGRIGVAQTTRAVSTVRSSGAPGQSLSAGGAG